MLYIYFIHSIVCIYILYIYTYIYYIYSETGEEIDHMVITKDNIINTDDNNNDDNNGINIYNI